MNQNRTLIGSFIYITKRRGGSNWTADYHWKGKHCRTSLKTKNEREARRRAVDLEQDLESGNHNHISRSHSRHSSLGSVQLKTTIQDFLEFQTTEGRRPKSITKYRGVLKVFAEFCEEISCTAVNDISLTVIDQYRSRRNQELMARSMTFEGNLLKQFFQWCVVRRLISSNPLESMSFPKVRLERKDVLSFEQIESILSASTPYRRPLIATLAFTGMRSGELCHLRLTDVNFRDGWIHIVSRPGFETKSGLSRKVPLHPRLREELSDVSRRGRPWFFTAPASDRYPDGNHFISTKKLNEDFQTKLRQLGIPTGRHGGFTIHSLRHFFRTHTVNERVPERVINEWVGHAPDRSMGSVYYHLTDEQSQYQMNQLSFRLEPDQTG